MQSEVSLTALAIENRDINPSSVVPDTQSELPIVITDFDLDPFWLRVPKGVPKRLGCQLVDFVPHDREQFPRFTPNRDMERWPMAGRPRFDLFSERADGQREIASPPPWNRAIPAPHHGLR